MSAHAVGEDRQLRPDVRPRRNGDDRVSGQLAREGQPAVPFSGWLELLQLLEDLADDMEAPFEGAEQ